jgi:alanine dehydrogenase
VLILSRADVAALLTLDDCIPAVERAFRAHAEGATLAPGALHVDAHGGEFHIKAGGLAIGDRAYFALKANGGFFGNPARGLPAIQGAIYLADATLGTPLAMLDSGLITALRTGAATAVAARYLARDDARTATILGAGRQARIQLQALARVRPLDTIYVWDRTAARAQAFAAEMTAILETPVAVIDRPRDGTLRSAMIVTCTASRQALLQRDDIAPGTFIAAVGADSPDKQELDPAILRDATVVCDLTSQCAGVGELHHAIAAGYMTAHDVHAELGALIVGRVPGRRTHDEITVFDSTGTALQDAAAAAVVFERAVEQGRGAQIALA